MRPYAHSCADRNTNVENPFEYNAAKFSNKPVPKNQLSDGELEGKIRSNNDMGIIDFSKGRRKKFINLRPGTTYFFTQFVINARGVGSMSDPVSIVCY